MAPTRSERHSVLRARIRLLQIGLLLPVLITLVLGLAYLRAIRAQQHAVAAAGREIARRFSEQTLIEANRLGDRAARTILGAAVRSRPATPASIFAAMQRATDSLRACRCGPLKEGAFFFLWDPERKEFLTSHPPPPGRQVQASLPHALPEPTRQFIGLWAAGGRDPKGPWLVHYTVLRLASGRLVAAGLDITMDSWWSGTFVPAIAATSRQFFPMLPRADTSLSVALIGDGEVVARTRQVYSGPSVRAQILGGDFFNLEVTLNPGMLPSLTTAGIPGGFLLPLALLGATILVSVAGLALLRQLRDTLARRESFVTSIAHELRTPLTTMLLHGESLALNRDTPDAKERAAGGIVRETRRLIGLVENALTAAGAGRASERPVIALAPVVEATLDALRPSVEARQARVSLELDRSLCGAIDPVALDRILTNLMENALRYGPPGQTIVVRLRSEGGWTTLTVSDEGPGVAAAERRRIWDSFERGTAARNSRDSGLGLGLAIVKELSEAAGGRVSVGGGAAGGAVFTVTLPRVQAAAQPVGPEPDRADTAPHTTSCSAPGLR